ncbi:restriction endonuclease subunit S [Halopseudomonas yangmingensis]|nr:restriction endonuclease subunit S [Halopseudomonas yangmingensis]
MGAKRERYTPNDVGPSPLEWGAPRLSEVSILITNGFVGTATPFYTDNTGVPYLYGTNVRANKLELDTVRYITQEFHEAQSKTALKPGDLLTVQSGHIGETAVVTSQLDGANCHALIVTRLKKEKANPEFLSYYINSEIGRARMRGLEVGSTILHINTKDLKKFRVLLPSIPEQKKIAQILSTWDKAITTTEQLLANSQQQKKALMQQLLTGKKRFPGFEGVWKKYTLGELGNTFNGLTGKTKEDFGFGKKYIPYINIFKNSRIDVRALELVDVNEGESQSLSQYGDIFFTTSSETPDEVGMSSVLLDHVDELYLNSFCFGYRLFGFESLHPEFASYLLRSEHVRGEIAVLGQGATRYNLSKKQLMKLKLTLPPVDEQKKIASVLSDADQEIGSLQSQLEGLKQEKKALMQQLLTGKRRVTLN